MPTISVGPGETYTTLSAALAGEDGYDCVTNTQDIIFDCANFEDTTRVNATGGLSIGYTTNDTYKVIIRAADSHGGHGSACSTIPMAHQAPKD